MDDENVSMMMRNGEMNYMNPKLMRTPAQEQQQHTNEIGSTPTLKMVVVVVVTGKDNKENSSSVFWPKLRAN